MVFLSLEVFEGDQNTAPRMHWSSGPRWQTCTRHIGFRRLMFRGDGAQGPQASAIVGPGFSTPWVVSVGYMAAHTTKSRLGTASIALLLRNPLHTAKGAASIEIQQIIQRTGRSALLWR